ALAHRMADLVEADHDIARGEQAGNVGSHMAVDDDAAVLAEVRTSHLGELDVRVAAERGIDAVERVVALCSIDDDAIAGDGDSPRRSIDAFNSYLLQLRSVFGFQTQRFIGRN